jgi:prepilin-type processing-associated H-X9-DG protein
LERIYDGGLPAGVSGLPLPATTWRAAPSDYSASTGVFDVFGTVAYSGNPGGNRHGTLQDHVHIPGLYQGSNRDARFADISDGTTNTFLFGERTGGNVIYSKRQPSATLAALVPSNGGGWGDPLNGEHWLGGTLHSGLPTPPQHGPCGINCTNLRSHGFHSFHPGGAQFGMADGSVQFMSETANALAIAGRITRQKAELLPD